jgi:hypothetical protein
VRKAACQSEGAFHVFPLSTQAELCVFPQYMMRVSGPDFTSLHYSIGRYFSITIEEYWIEYYGTIMLTARIEVVLKHIFSASIGRFA